MMMMRRRRKWMKMVGGAQCRVVVVENGIGKWRQRLLVVR